MDTYEQYEKECKKIRKENEKLLEGFEQWLSDQKLSPKTVKQHVFNIDFYINEYLLYDDVERAAEGYGLVNMFLGYWYIRKAMWSSKEGIRQNAASLKKFYKYLLGIGEIDQEALDYLKETIKRRMPEWISRVR